MGRRVPRPSTGVVSLLWLLALAPGLASAHDVTGSRFDAPLPLSLLLAGAGGTVALTALWLAVTDRTTATTGRWGLVTVRAETARWARRSVCAVFFAAVVGALADGLLGRQVAAENAATVFVWPVWFRGVALVAIVVGSPWTTLSPWRTLYDGLCRLEGDQVAVREYPDWLGAWPALVGVLGLVGVVETLTVVPRSPRLTAVVLSGYALAMVAGAVAFGPTWFERADPLETLYRLLGRVAAVTTARSPAGDIELSLRPPWRGCTTPVSGVAAAAVVVAAVYTVSFDGFSNTRGYQTVLLGARAALGTGPETSVLLYLGGFLAFVGGFAATLVVGDALGRPGEAVDAAAATDGGAGGWRGAVRRFAPTVLPIAAAYEVAHNYPYVVRSAARLVELGADRLGAAVGPLAPLAPLSLPAFWGSQVLLIVVGHVVAVVAAHRVAVERYPSPAAARRGHLPLVVLMVGYTVLSLWIVSRPVVAG